MFNMLTNLAKAAVAVAITPVDLVVDIVSLPATAVSDDHNKGPFDHTAARLKQAEKALEESTK